MRPTTLLLTLVWLSTAAAATEEASPPVETAPSGTRVASQASEDGTSPRHAAEQTAATLDKSLPFKAEHPGDTALSQDENGKWQIRSFPALATLYTYDKDTPGKSNCGAPCSSAWPPLLASKNEKKPVGDWSLIPRPDGRQQWAYKGQPVYLRYHDFQGDEENIRRAGFQILEP